MPLPIYSEEDDIQRIDQLIEEAGERKSPPPPPKGGIPPQRLPAFIRWMIRALFIPFILLDMSIQNAAKAIVKTPFIRKGQCHQRGNCCYYVLIERREGFFGRLFFLWSTEVNGFYPREDKPYPNDGKEVYVMGCRHLRKDGRCGIYRWRPRICREWPRIEYFEQPQTLKGCGFYPELRKEKK